jgi:glyoxylase-like metal-dependent hydrolase (beta-lactamase superfamily II)
MEQHTPRVWLQRSAAQGFPVVSSVVLTGSRAFVIDTLTGPQDMEPVRELLRGTTTRRPPVVVNTHHHWDHVYGNAAFEGMDIVAHATCPRLLREQERLSREQEGFAAPPPPPREGLPAPGITFDQGMAFLEDDEMVHLRHAPGHSPDSIVVWLERDRLMFAGDALEWPLPSLDSPGGLDTWLRTLASLKDLPIDAVVPSHGPVMGKTLIDANAAYIEGLRDAVAFIKRSGGDPRGLDLPVRRFVAADVTVDDVYSSVHRLNIARMWDEV